VPNRQDLANIEKWTVPAAQPTPKDWAMLAGPCQHRPGLRKNRCDTVSNYYLPQISVRLDSGFNFIGRTDCITLVIRRAVRQEGLKIRIREKPAMKIWLE
jgi:hypothetical protein